MPEVVLEVLSFVEPSATIVDTAELVATATLAELTGGNTVVVSFCGVRGVTSSFFNVLLARVLARHGKEVLDGALRMRFDSRAQEMMFNRSREVALRPAG